MRHVIKNFSSLATTKLRRHALTIAEAGIKAVNTERLIRNRVWRSGMVLAVGEKTFDLKKFRRIFVIGIGKASFGAAVALEKILGSCIYDGIVLDIKSGPLKRIKSIAGTHPFPSISNTRATGEIMGILKALDSRDLLLAIISGGGSTLLCWPYTLKCDELSLATKLLMKRGATIQELNTIRKHLSEIQGGQFARLAFPATVIGLIFSDVPGNDLSMVASGPTFLDKTSAEDALKILTKYDVINQCNLPGCDVKETPKDRNLFGHVYNILIANNKNAVDGMMEKAQRLGYHPRLFSIELTGEAREIGRLLSSSIRPGEALIAAGETTVTVSGSGRGGRNQEVALGSLPLLYSGSIVLSCASDGIDNTPVAGAFVDNIVSEYIKKRKLDPQKFLQENNSYEFFRTVKTHIKTGITGVNVSDFMLSLREK